ncbi:MAG TPA: response regulator [Terriglobales bacterium]|nr:response regulator [Terriglobales bacterium]
MARKPKHRILVVDDDLSNREYIAELLASHGYDVSTAADGFDALLQLTQEPPDVIISDLNMPNMSGAELLSIVRRGYPHTLLIAMSGAYESGAIPAGVVADAFFAKGQQEPKALVRTTGDLISASVAPPESN